MILCIRNQRDHEVLLRLMIVLNLVFIVTACSTIYVMSKINAHLSMKSYSANCLSINEQRTILKQQCELDIHCAMHLSCI